MLSFGNKDFRNLQEQVLKNMQDIQDIEEGATVLADFGIKIVGQVDSSDDLPDPATYDGEYGDAYIVGESDPYDYYIFTRAFEGQENPSWFNLGQFPVPGPQGETGPQGPVGATPNIIIDNPVVTTLEPGQAATATVGTWGTAASPHLLFYFGIPKGAQGIQGPQGAQGPQGPQGPKGDKGEKGEQGGLIEIVGIVATANDLPSPATLQKLDAAYLVGTSPDYELYVQVGEAPSTALWTNLGAINEGTVVTVGGVGQPVWNADTKISVFDGQLVNTLYGEAAGTGNGQTHVPYGDSASANYIVQRDVNAQINVPITPTSNVHAASKKYVDDTASSVLPTEYAGDLIVGSSTAHVGYRLPIGSAGQVLKVNSSSNGLEYASIEEIPAIAAGDAGKVLTVSANEAGTEWTTVSSGGGSLPWKSSNTSVFSSNVSTINGTAIEDYNATAFNNSLILAANNSINSFTNANQINRTIVLGYIGTSSDNLYRLNNSSDSILLKYGANIRGEFDRDIISLNTNPSLPSSNATNSLKGTYFNANKYTINCNTLNGAGNIIACGGDFLNFEGAGLNSYMQISNSLIVGNHKIKGTPAGKAKAIVGDFGIWDSSTNSSDIFMVGCGTSSSALANCFAVGNDGTDDYIKIGDTKLTEPELITIKSGGGGSNGIDLDFTNKSGTQRIEISSAIYTAITNLNYEYININNYGGAGTVRTLTLGNLEGSESKYQRIETLTQSANNSGRSLSTGYLSLNAVQDSNSSTGYSAYLGSTTGITYFAKKVMLTGASGTISDKPKFNYAEAFQFYYQVSAGTVASPIIWETFDTGSPNWGVGYAMVYASADDASPTKYIIKYSGSNWTATAA